MRRQRDVHDRGVQPDDEQARAADAENQQPPPSRQLRHPAPSDHQLKTLLPPPETIPPASDHWLKRVGGLSAGPPRLDPYAWSGASFSTLLRLLRDVMSLRLIPFADPGVPDTRSGLRLILWLEHQQLRGQALAVFWGLLYFGGIAAAPIAVGLAVQAVIDLSWPKLILAGVLLLAFGAAKAGADSFFHRAAVTNWITAAARVQQLLARKAAELGSALTRRVAAGEVVAVVHRRRGEDRLVRGGALAGSRPPLLTVAARSASPCSSTSRRSAWSSPSACRCWRSRCCRCCRPATRRADAPAGEGRPGHRAGLRHRRRAAGAARHRRRGAVPRPLPPRLAGGPRTPPCAAPGCGR